MSHLLGNLKNNIAYHIHSLTYNPEAEKFAEQQAKEAAKEKATTEAVKQQKATATAATAAKKKAADERAAQAKAEEERNTFSGGRMVQRTLSIAMKILGAFLLVALAFLGASLAMNLNVYKPWPYRLFYFFYGLVGFFIVIPYVLLYRWAWLGKRPRFYALFPLVDGIFTNPLTAFLLSWMSFLPDQFVKGLDPCLE